MAGSGFVPLIVRSSQWRLWVRSECQQSGPQPQHSWTKLKVRFGPGKDNKWSQYPLNCSSRMSSFLTPALVSTSAIAETNAAGPTQ